MFALKDVRGAVERPLPDLKDLRFEEELKW
jgi:hypothetical protein